MKKLYFLILVFIACANVVFAQEQGRFKNVPKIKPYTAPKSKEKTTPPKRDVEDEIFEEEEPKLRFNTDYEPRQNFEPIKDLNEVVNERDTTTIDENNDIMIVEIEEEAQFEGSDEMITTAQYFSVWATNEIDPYDIDAKEFEDVIPIQLYDTSQNKHWSPPLDAAVVTSKFGWRSGRWHTGIDLDLQTGDNVYAAFDGVVRVSGWHGGYGWCMVVRHYNGIETLYGHLSRRNLEANTFVKAGDVIALGGNSGRSSGSHLHFETMYEGNRFDPREIFFFPPNQIVSDKFWLSPRVYDYLRGGVTRNQFELEDDAPKRTSRKMWIRVRSGDTLTEIANKFRTSPDKIARLNRISSHSRLRAGARIRVK